MGFNGDLYPTSGATSVLTTKGDIVRYNTERERYGIGSAGQVLQVASSLPTWSTINLADSVLTTQGDVLYEGASALARLGQSTNNYTLATKGSGQNPAWQASSTSVMSTTGDLLYASGANTLARLGIGSTDDVLKVAGGVPTWSARASGGAWAKAGSDIQTGYVSDLEVTGITASDVYQIIYYISDDADPTGENCEPKLQRNGGGSTYDDAQSIFTGSSESQYGNTNADQWSLGKVSNKHSWAGVVYVWSYNGNFSNSYQDGTVMRGMTMTTAWNGTDTFGQNDATTDITSFKLSMMMSDDTVIDCNGSLQVNTFDYST